MSEEVLLSLTKQHLETGLRGIPVGYCTTSKVDPVKGLYYGGYPIAELAYRKPEEVIYLLRHGTFPSPEQLADFQQQLRQRYDLDEAVFDHLRSLPKSAHPMKWFLSGINAMGMCHTTEDWQEDYLSVLARLPIMVAALFRIRNGWGEPIRPNPELGYMENFSAMLGAPDASEHLPELMRVFNILHYDHGGGNLSTFVGKAIASAHADMYESLLGAMAGLAGPLHGKANQECLRFLRDTLPKVQDPDNEASVRNFCEQVWESGGKLYGFGHAVLRVEDPRATVQYELGEKIAPQDPYFRLACTLRKVGSEFLSTKEKVSNPYPNVDAVSGSLLNASGLTDENYYTVLFGLSRCVGIATQILYERTQARGGKGTPIIRPKYIYSGPEAK